MTEISPIIYVDTGKLSYDADGVNGAAGTLFAILPTGLALTHADFIVTSGNGAS